MFSNQVVDIASSDPTNTPQDTRPHYHEHMLPTNHTANFIILVIVFQLVCMCQLTYMVALVFDVSRCALDHAVPR
jgi:hypothetical protein